MPRYTPEQQDEHCLTLAAFLDTLPEHRYDHRAVVSEWRNNAPTDGLCGSVCCAYGWAPRVFPEAFEWDRGWGVRPRSDAFDEDTYAAWCISRRGPTNAFFGEGSWDRIFATWAYSTSNDIVRRWGAVMSITPTVVATRVRKFVADRRAAR